MVWFSFALSCALKSSKYSCCTILRSDVKKVMLYKAPEAVTQQKERENSLRHWAVNLIVAFYHPSRALLPFLCRCFLLPFRFTAATAATYAVLCCICVHAASFLHYMISIFLSFSPPRRLSSLSLRFFVEKNKIFWVKTLIFWRELHCPEAHCLDPSNYRSGITKFALSAKGLESFSLTRKTGENLVKVKIQRLWVWKEKEYFRSSTIATESLIR